MLNSEQSGVTLALNSGGLAIGSTTSQFSVATAVNYIYRGVFGQRATDASEALTIVNGTGIVPTAPNTLQNLAVGEACSFLVVVRVSDSALLVVQSPIVPADQGSVPIAAVPSGHVAIGAIKVVANTAAFTVGTTALNAAGVTTTYFNFGSHPGRSL